MKNLNLKKNIKKPFYYSAKSVTVPTRQFGAIWKREENKFKIIALIPFGLIIPFILYPLALWLNRKFIQGGFTLSAITDSFGYLKFPTFWEFWATYLGFAALFIGIIVILTIVGDVANNTREFLIIFEDILQKCGVGDEVVIIAPTIMIERRRNRADYEGYKQLLLSNLAKGIKVTFCFFETTFFDNYPHGQEQYKRDGFIAANKENDPLINFHLTFLSKSFVQSDEAQERLEYFDELWGFFQDLNSSDNFTYIPLKKDSYDNNFVAVANETKGVYFLGAYRIEEHSELGKIFDYSASRFESSASKETFNQFLNGTIELLSDSRNGQVEEEVTAELTNETSADEEEIQEGAEVLEEVLEKTAEEPKIESGEFEKSNEATPIITEEQNEGNADSVEPVKKDTSTEKESEEK